MKKIGLFFALLLNFGLPMIGQDQAIEYWIIKQKFNNRGLTTLVKPVDSLRVWVSDTIKITAVLNDPINLSDYGNPDSLIKSAYERAGDDELELIRKSINSALKFIFKGVLPYEQTTKVIHSLLVSKENNILDFFSRKKV